MGVCFLLFRQRAEKSFYQTMMGITFPLVRKIGLSAYWGGQGRNLGLGGYYRALLCITMINELLSRRSLECLCLNRGFEAEHEDIFAKHLQIEHTENGRCGSLGEDYLTKKNYD